MRLCELVTVQKISACRSIKAAVSHGMNSFLIFLALLSGVSRFGYYSTGATDLVVRATSVVCSLGAIGFLVLNNHIGRDRCGRLSICMGLVALTLLILNLFAYSGSEHLALLVLFLPAMIVLLFFLSQIYSMFSLRDIFLRQVVFYAFVLIIIGFFEQLGLVHFNGQSFAYSNLGDYMIRPASLTGSYLHLPIVLFLIGGFLVAATKRLDWIALFVLGYPLTVGSRSAFVLVLPFFLIAFIFRKRLEIRWVLEYRFAAVALVLILMHMIAIITYSYGDHAATIQQGAAASMDRSLNAFALSAPGNAGRISSWNEAVEKYVGLKNIFVGDLGCCGNFANKLLQIQLPVLESSLFLLIANFGILFGFIAYALVFFQAKVSKNLIWMVVVGIFLVHSLIYQSLEVYSVLFLGAVFSSVMRPKGYTRHEVAGA